MTKINQHNFFLSSISTFEYCERPLEEPNFISGKGQSRSEYWYIDGVLYRCSNHWINVFKCIWYIILPKYITLRDNPIFSAKNTYIDSEEVRICGKCNFSDMIHNDNLTTDDINELKQYFDNELIDSYMLQI